MSSLINSAKSPRTMRSEGKVQDESFTLHSCVAHLPGADPVPGGDLETERQQSPPSGWETNQDPDNDLFYKCWGSQGLLELFSLWGWGRHPSPLTVSGIFPPPGALITTGQPNTQDACWESGGQQTLWFLLGNFNGKPWPDTANGLSFEDKPPPSMHQVRTVSCLLPTLCDLGPLHSHP